MRACRGGMSAINSAQRSFAFAAWYGRARQNWTGSKQQEATAVEGWFVRERDRLGVGPGGGDRGYSGQGRRAHRGQLFQQQERGGSDRRRLPQGGRSRGRGGAGRRR